MERIKVWHVFLLTGLLGLIALFYQGLWGNPSYIPPVIVHTQAPEISAPEMHSGREVSLNRLKGKVVVLNFWASWCQECKMEHSSLLAINRRFQENPNFTMLGINYQDKEELAKQYLKVHGNNFNHVIDRDGRISIDYGIYGVPETFVIDQKGIIRYKTIGPLIGANYTHIVEKVIEPLLSGRVIS